MTPWDESRETGFFGVVGIRRLPDGAYKTPFPGGAYNTPLPWERRLSSRREERMGFSPRDSGVARGDSRGDAQRTAHEHRCEREFARPTRERAACPGREGVLRGWPETAPVRRRSSRCL